MKSVILFFLILISGCITDNIEYLTNVKNESKIDIYIIESNNKFLKDEQIFYGDKYLVKNEKNEKIYGMNGYSNYDTIYFFALNAAVVDSAINLKKIKGIFNRSFLHLYILESQKKEKNIVYPNK